MQIFGNESRMEFDRPRLRIVADKSKPQALDMAGGFRYLEAEDPDLILVLGGDGFMLDTIRKYYKGQVPFLGINFGNVGFLLNDKRLFSGEFPREMRIYTLPVLRIEATLVNNEKVREVAFNDTWVKAGNNQSTAIRLEIDGTTRVSRLVGDGLLVATPTGSTAYARAMGASPVPLDAQVLVLAGNNVSEPFTFRHCNLPITSKIVFTNLEPEKRPLIGVVDGIEIGKILSAEISVSKTANIKLVNVGEHGLPEKLLNIQFPPSFR